MYSLCIGFSDSSNSHRAWRVSIQVSLISTSVPVCDFSFTHAVEPSDAVMKWNLLDSKDGPRSK